MRGLMEFRMEDLVSTQLLIGETIGKMHNIIVNNLVELGRQTRLYEQESIDALELLWKNFEDNNLLLIEDEFKEHGYFRTKIFDKVKTEYVTVIFMLRQLLLVALPQENSQTQRLVNIPQSQQDMFIGHQRLRFTFLEESIRGINIDSINKTDAMELTQKDLKQQWNIIHTAHKTIREKYDNIWPELKYELDYVRYKNMYETTYSLFNYKIDACSLVRKIDPSVHVVPYIGIPTWRMFENNSEVHPFAVHSAAWKHFIGQGEVIHKKQMTEGEKRQLLIRTFLTYQNDEKKVMPQSDVKLEEFKEFQIACEEPLLLPLDYKNP